MCSGVSDARETDYLRSEPSLGQHEFFFHSIHLSELELLYCGYEHCFPGHCFGPTMRDHFFYHFVASGRGIFRSDRSYELRAGSGFFALPSQITYYEADSDDPWSYLWVGAKGDFLSSLSDRVGEPGHCPVLTHKEPDQVRGIMNRLIRCSQESSLSSYLTATGLFFSLLAVLYRDADASQDAQVPVRDVKAKVYVEQAKEFMQNNYSKDISMAALAQHIGLDEDYLARIFKKELNTTPSVFLRTYRMGLANKLLLNTSMSVKEIAAAVGIPDPQYFCRCFTESQGVSPRTLRKANRL